ncbi:MAG: T9SS type A sorting domain-containing protein [Ignavibacteriaceae bacterium]
MKIKFLLFVLLTILSITSNEIFAQWTKTILPNPPYGHGALPGKVVTLASNGSNLYAGTLGGNLYFSPDSGSTWAYIDSGLTTADINAIAIQDSIIILGTYGSGTYGSTWGGLFISTNNGKSWTQAKGLTNNNIYSIVFKGPDIFVSTWGGGIFVSIDNGVTWNKSNSGLTNLYVRTLLVSGNYLYAGTWGDGVFFSNDNGNSWIQLNNGLTNLYIYHFALKGSTLYMGNDAGIFTSTNNGLNWVPSNSGLTTSFIRSFEVIDPKILVGTSGEGVFLSLDNGATWTPVDSGLTEPFIYCFANVGNSIFAGSWNGEIWIRSVNEILKTMKKTTVTQPAPTKYVLNQNYPNPFNPSTIISFSVPQKSRVSLKIYDALGRLVSNLIDGEVKPSGNYNVSFNAGNLASGIYFYRLITNNYVSTKKMLLMK